MPLASAALRLFTRPSPAAPRLSVVVVSYHAWPDTARLVGQLEDSTALRDGAAEVVVVDNGSGPHPVAAHLRRTEGVSLRRWRHNRGFARGVHEAARLSRGEWLLLLNPDVTLPPGFLDDALAHADRLRDARPNVGVVGFGVRNPDGSRQLSTGRFPTFLGTLAGLLRPRAVRKYHAAPADRPTPVDWVTGCCLLIRRDCWRRLGGLDRDFFLYYEDADLCRRARHAGWVVLHEPRLAVTHHLPLHARTVSPALRFITRHALLTYARKHWHPVALWSLAALVRAEAWLKAALGRGNRDPHTAGVFEELQAAAAAFAAGDGRDARRRLLAIVRHEDHRRAALVDRHPQPPPRRPAPRLPRQRHPLPAA